MGERNVQKYAESFTVLCYNTLITVGYLMPICAKSLSRSLEGLINLEQQMLELLALRRALCLANASRNWPTGARRRLRASGAKSVLSDGRRYGGRYSAASPNPN